MPDDPEPPRRLTEALDGIWKGVVLADNRFHPDKSCFQLAEEYRRTGRTPLGCANKFVAWQAAKAAMAGFALGLPGIAAMPITVPVDFASVAYLQLRMVAVIGLLFGWEPESDQLRSIAYMSLLGSAGAEAAHDAGVIASVKFAGVLLNRVPGKALTKVNQFVGFRLLTKAGTKGVLNFTKIVPIIGGVAGGGINYATTRKIGLTAIQWLQDGPTGTAIAADEA
ncbi:MAG: EcsC family protein [Rhodospirillales bacterium]